MVCLGLTVGATFWAQDNFWIKGTPVPAVQDTSGPFLHLYAKSYENPYQRELATHLTNYRALRFSDLLTLEWKHINWKENKIRKNLYKEKVAHEIPLDDSAKEILARWEKKNYNRRFVFDLLPEDFDLDDVALLDIQRKAKNRALHTSLRTLGEKLPSKLTFNLSIHTARHSFVIKALSDGMPTHLISKLMGHRSIAATERAYAKFMPKNIAEEIRTKFSI